MPENEKTLAQALSETFKGNTPASEFIKELRALSVEDKAWFKDRFEKEFGYIIVEKKQ